MNQQPKIKHCLVCKCELPSGSIIPVCRHHRDVAKDGMKYAGGVVVGLGGFALIGAKTKSLSKAADFLIDKVKR